MLFVELVPKKGPVERIENRKQKSKYEGQIITN